MLNVSYAQNFEDILINRLFQKQKGGFYIDVGAAHPQKDSVTKYFYQRGWRGINIEPNRDYFELLKKQRVNDTNLNCAVLNKAGEVRFTKVSKDPKISYVGEAPLEKYEHVYDPLEKESLTVQARTLTDICLEFAPNEKVDFLKIDVEGSEESVLEGIDFSSIKPRLIILEAVDVKGSEKSDSSYREEILSGNGYIPVYFDGINSYYAQESDLEAKKVYSVPLNASDNPLPFRNTRFSFLMKILVNRLSN